MRRGQSARHIEYLQLPLCGQSLAVTFYEQGILSTRSHAPASPAAPQRKFPSPHVARNDPGHQPLQEYAKLRPGSQEHRN